MYWNATNLLTKMLLLESSNFSSRMLCDINSIVQRGRWFDFMINAISSTSSKCWRSLSTSEPYNTWHCIQIIQMVSFTHQLQLPTQKAYFKQLEQNLLDKLRYITDKKGNPANMELVWTKWWLTPINYNYQPRKSCFK